MDINNMTKKDFEALPFRKSWSEDVICTSIVIIPGRAKDMHESGYRIMDFIAVDKGEAKCRLSGCSDVIHVDGIGGYGERGVARGVPTLVPTSGWSIDCLPKSGLLHMWPTSGKIKAGDALSSFEIYALAKD